MKECDPITFKLFKSDESIMRFKGECECDQPNEQLYKFEGRLSFEGINGTKEEISLSQTQLLLWGSSLRNTEYIYGFVVYTGHKTRIMMN